MPAADAGFFETFRKEDENMFDWLLPEDHAISIIKKDHDEARSLFDEFEKTDSAPARDRIVEKAVEALKIHAALEEEIFYPAVRSRVGAKIMDEADEEHHVAKVLIAELEAGAADPGHRRAKFTVLAESVRHHIREEEDEMLPKAREASLDFEALGARMLARKSELKKTGVPSAAEAKMVEKAGRNADSPAAAARRTRAAQAPRRAKAKAATRSKTRAGKTRKRG
jgi:hypothetical protein